MREPKGKFYKRVLWGILWPVLIFILITIVAITFLLIQLDESGNDSRRIIFSKQKNSITSSVLSIQKTLSELKNFAIEEWIDSEPNNYRYYYSTQIYKILTKMGVSLDQTPIDVSLIVDYENPMVMTYSGSGDFDWYSKNYVNLSDEQIDSLKWMVSSRMPGISTFPVYKGNTLSDIYIAIPYDTKHGGRMVIVTRLYASSCIELEENEQAYIVLGDTIIPYINDSNAVAFIKENQDRILSFDFIADNETSFISVLPNPWIQFIATFSNNPTVLFWVTIAIIIALSLLAVGTMIVLMQTNHIYQPVSAAISTDTYDETGSYDEFEIIRKRSQQIKDLSNELKLVLEQRNQLEQTRYYRFLLDGTVNIEEENDEDNYIVALVQFNDAERGLDVQYFQLTLEEKNTIYVPYGFNRFALIYKNIDCAKARIALEEILGEISNEASFNASISDIVEGKTGLKYAFQQCLHLLSFTTFLRTYRIITPSDIPSQIKDFYHYSAQTESKLISLVVTGVPQAKNEYDSIVEENLSDKTLSEKTKLEFAYCMVFTIQRIFCELNKSPKELLGEDINFAAMLWQRSYKAVLAETKDIIYKIIDNTHSLSSESDAQLLMMMKKYIHENYMYDIGLQDLADCFNITPKYCGMLFSKLSNDTFKNYLNNYRVEEAKEIIRSNPTIKITDLSLKVGFNSSTSFIRVFSKYTGITPKTFADQEALNKQESIFDNK